MALPTQWTWVWVNSGSWWGTGRSGVLRFMGLQRVGHDWVTDLIWSDSISLDTQSMFYLFILLSMDLFWFLKIYSYTQCYYEYSLLCVQTHKCENVSCVCLGCRQWRSKRLEVKFHFPHIHIQLCQLSSPHSTSAASIIYPVPFMNEPMSSDCSVT